VRQGDTRQRHDFSLEPGRKKVAKRRRIESDGEARRRHKRKIGTLERPRQ